MKKIHYLLFIAASIAISSCASDNQDPVSPSTDLRDNFVAYWNVIENSTIAGQNSFVVNVAKSTTNANEIIF